MPISLIQHSQAVTRVGIAMFEDRKEPLPGLAAFFPTKTSPSKEISAEIRRHRLLAADDVAEGGDPTRVTFSNWTEKIWVPPLYSLSIDFKTLQGYEASFGRGLAPNAAAVDVIANDLANRLLDIRSMIVRATEIQRSQALKTGIVTLKNYSSIDYKRKADSTVTLSGGDMWSSPDANIYGQLETWTNFIRQEGLTTNENEFWLILGSQALGYFMNNNTLKDRASFFNNIRTVDIKMPGDAPVTGMKIHGQISVGDTIINLLTYSGFYEDKATGSKVKYISPTQVTLLAGDFVGATAYGGLERVFNYGSDNQSVQTVEADFQTFSYIELKRRTWDIVTESRPLAVPISVDRVVTAIVASS